MSKGFTELEQRHLNSFIWKPSPKGRFKWKFYIENRVALLESGMAVYASYKYTRLKLSKYIESNRASDNIAKSLTNNKPSAIFIGGANTAPNSPIGIKKRLRCPGTRKLVNSFKKLGNCVIIFVDEWMTSQTCSKCFTRFDRRTRSHRFKVCRNCRPIENGALALPRAIVSKIGKRHLKRERRQKRIEIEREHANNVNQPAQIAAFPAPKPRLVSKIKINFKMMLNDAGECELFDDQATTVWHRDIVAARCILYKGM